MSAASFTANLAAYVLQTALLMLVGLLLPKLFGMSDPRVRLRYWHALLTVSLLLPFAWLAWRPQAPTFRSFTGILAGGMELEVKPGAAPLHLSPWIWVPVALAAVAVARALWLAGGMLYLERLRRRGRALNPLPEPFEDASRTLFVDADFRVSQSVSTPLTFGWLRPVVFVPEAVAGMSPDEQRCVALHELLHVRRRDWLASLAEEALRSILWFHPAVWLVLDRVALSREQVVDREVVSITEARRTYMNTLSAMARTRYPAAAVAILPFFHRSHLLQRLALLTQEVSMSRFRLGLASAGCVLVLLLAGTLAARAFPLVSGDRVPGKPTAKAADTAKTPIPSSKVYEMGTPGIAPPKLLNQVAPAYPEDLKAKGVQGRVVVEAVIDGEGKPSKLTVVKSDNAGLDAAALDAVKQWRWEPPMLDGQPVSVKWYITLNFRLS